MILLPGYSASPVGGYSVVYQYANYLCSLPDIQVVIVHDGFRLVNTIRPTPRRILSLIKGSLSFHLGKIGVRKFKPWARWDPRIEVENSIRSLDDLRLGTNDLVLATAVETALTAELIAKTRGCAGWYFLQHVETWNYGREYLDNTIRSSLRKIAVAPWIRDYCADLGEPCEVVLNAVDGESFPLGSFGPRRKLVSTLLSPGIPLKRTDIAIDVLNGLVGLGYPAAAFGAKPRPRSLDSRVVYKRLPDRLTLLDLYQRSRVFFCVSQTEGFGLTPAEATLAGAAIVSTNNGGVEAYAESFGRFTGEPDVGRTIAAVVDLMRNPEEARSRAERGREQLMSYTPENASKEFARILLEADPPKAQ
ncbi:glycosyltransferase family 4 protein [Acidipropionibacterium jensenii]|uniref:glycosyltransferase family 4 protein n=1 Tax=Acidipropionibacterium jensenii TaxID=1749 RepID=UPI0015863BF3|nr:glycosyltransferase family 4 protein [Acidipropionibacterium jensenii]